MLSAFIQAFTRDKQQTLEFRSRNYQIKPKYIKILLSVHVLPVFLNTLCIYMKKHVGLAAELELTAEFQMALHSLYRCTNSGIKSPLCSPYIVRFISKRRRRIRFNQHSPRLAADSVHGNAANRSPCSTGKGTLQLARGKKKVLKKVNKNIKNKYVEVMIIAYLQGYNYQHNKLVNLIVKQVSLA